MFASSKMNDIHTQGLNIVPIDQNKISLNSQLPLWDDHPQLKGTDSVRL